MSFSYKYLIPFQSNDFVHCSDVIHAFLVDKMTHMVGSYPPKSEIQSYTTPFEEAPSGMITRGTYSVTSLFTDDDKNEHLKWDWKFEIKEDW